MNTSISLMKTISFFQKKHPKNGKKFLFFKNLLSNLLNNIKKFYNLTLTTVPSGPGVASR